MRHLIRTSQDRARPYYVRNAGAPWSQGDMDTLRTLAEGNTPTRVIGFKLGRTAKAVHRKAAQLGISLKPVNQSPYGRAA